MGINGSGANQVIPVRVNKRDLQVQLNDPLAHSIRPEALPTMIIPNLPSSAYRLPCCDTAESADIFSHQFEGTS